MKNVLIVPGTVITYYGDYSNSLILRFALWNYKISIYGFPQPTSQGIVFLWFLKNKETNDGQTPQNRAEGSRAINH